MTELSILENKTIFISGATGALGSALSRIAHQYNARLILTARKQDALESLADQLEIPDAILWPCNFKEATPASLQAGITEITQVIDSIDYVIHAAAQLGQQSPLMQYNPNTWMETVHINMNIPLFLTQFLMPYMDPQGQGRIGFINDPKACGKPYWGAYGLSKTLLKEMVHILKSELAPNGNIQAKLLEPTPFKSQLRKDAFPGSSSELESEPYAEAERLLKFLLK